MSNNRSEALHAAIHRDEPEVIANYLNSMSFNQEDLEGIGDWGLTPLEHAIEVGNLKIIQYLIEAGADIYFGVNDYLLNTAIRESRLDIVRLLIDSGVDVNLKGESDHTALMDAALSSSIEIVRLLVECGANVDSIRDDGMSALVCAALRGRKSIFNYLFDYASASTREIALEKIKSMKLKLSEVDSWKDENLY